MLTVTLKGNDLRWTHAGEKSVGFPFLKALPPLPLPFHLSSPSLTRSSFSLLEENLKNDINLHKGLFEELKKGTRG